MALIHGYDPDTLRERIDPAQCEQRLGELGENRSLPALLERIWLLKVLDRLDEAIELAEQAVRLARMASTRKDLLRVRILRATVRRARGEYPAAEQELTACAEEAGGRGWQRLAAFAHQNRGRVRFDTGDFEAAREDFKRALFLRQEVGVPDDQLEDTLLAIDAADRHRAGSSTIS